MCMCLCVCALVCVRCALCVLCVCALCVCVRACVRVCQILTSFFLLNFHINQLARIIENICDRRFGCGGGGGYGRVYMYA